MTAPWTLEPVLSFDLETSGVRPMEDRIVQVGSVLVWPDGSTTDEFEQIVNPGIDIPSEAALIHGISTSKAEAEGIAPAEALEHLADRIRQHGPHRALTAYNARFDVTMLIAEAERHGVDFPCTANVLDSFVLDKMADRYRKGSRKLIAVAQHYGVELAEAEAHGALADATAAGRLLWKLVDKYPTLGERSLATLWLKQARGHEDWRVGFEDYLRRSDPSAVVAGGWPIANAKEAS